MYLVKRQHGGFDGESAIPPSSNDDLSNGYYVAFILLVKDGTTWICEDATIGAAVWVQNTEDDEKIKSQINSLTDMIPRYCDNTFAAGSGRVSSSGISFETGFNTFFFLTYLLCTAFSFVVNGFSLKSFFISPFVGLFLFILVYPGFLVFFLAGAVLFHILLLFKDLFRNSS